MDWVKWFSRIVKSHQHCSHHIPVFNLGLNGLIYLFNDVKCYSFFAKGQPMIILGKEKSTWFQIYGYYKFQIDSVKSPIMSSCIKSVCQSSNAVIVLLHGFDSSCLEWRYTYPLLEEARVETWAVDIHETLPPCDASTKREHLYQFWKLHIKKPVVLVGASLGAAVAIDFAANYPEAVSKLVLIGACVYAKGMGSMTKLPKFIAYAGVNVLKNLPLRLYATKLAFNQVPKGSLLDWTRVKHKTLIIWGEDDRIINKESATMSFF